MNDDTEDALFMESLSKSSHLVDALGATDKTWTRVIVLRDRRLTTSATRPTAARHEPTTIRMVDRDEPADDEVLEALSNSALATTTDVAIAVEEDLGARVEGAVVCGVMTVVKRGNMRQNDSCEAEL